MTQFGRVVEVRTAGLLFRDHRIRVILHRFADNTQDSGTVDIWGLDRATETQIYKRGAPITVHAGYLSSVGQVFDGRIQHLERARITKGNIARVARIHLGDRVHAAGILGGLTVRSYSGHVLVQAIVRDLGQDLGMQVTEPSIQAIPRNATIRNWSFSGATADALDRLLACVDCAWFEDDGVIRIRRRGTYRQTDAAIINVTQGSGLLKAPIDTDEGVEVVTLLNPMMARGALVRLSTDSHRGEFICASFAHRGDNWKGDFQTWAELRAA